jgi:hypothetical protein
MSILSLSRTLLIACVFHASAFAGYSHYFTWRQQPDEAVLRKCIGDMRRIVDAKKNLLAGPDGEGAPVLEELELQFNGIGEEQSGEPLMFPGITGRIPGWTGPAGFNACKTNWKPYDQVVTACLIVARDHFPPTVLAIGSDGPWGSGGWAAGAKLHASVMGRPARNPSPGVCWTTSDLGELIAVLRGLRQPGALLLRACFYSL